MHCQKPLKPLISITHVGLRGNKNYRLIEKSFTCTAVRILLCFDRNGNGKHVESSTNQATGSSAHSWGNQPLLPPSVARWVFNNSWEKQKQPPPGRLDIQTPASPSSWLLLFQRKTVVLTRKSVFHPRAAVSKTYCSKIIIMVFH